MARPLVIYHANCLDGFGAAYAAYTSLRQGEECPCEFFAGVHGQPPPDATGRDLYILDFSYRRPVMDDICRSARSVTVIDHHVSAEQDLAGLEMAHGNLRALFDMNKSGAVLAWEYFHKAPPPALLLYIQDRDLWRFELEETNDVYAALMSRPFDFGVWEALFAQPDAVAALVEEGRHINRYRRWVIDLHKEKAVTGLIAGYRVPVVNCYEEIASDLLGELAVGHPFAAGYQDQGTMRKWSLRSNDAGVDVSAIAVGFGGGGHRNAAGFKTVLPSGLLDIDPGQ